MGRPICSVHPRTVPRVLPAVGSGSIPARRVSCFSQASPVLYSFPSRPFARRKKNLHRHLVPDFSRSAAPPSSRSAAAADRAADERSRSPEKKPRPVEESSASSGRREAGAAARCVEPVAVEGCQVKVELLSLCKNLPFKLYCR
ncbi:hypothetical protein ACJRO7_030573 [Eucalyptus globulus]|uniref:Uncharacterized protein n=1 Tax=Eucalyptus globulus TaxID=34317 RepID=A0ABD3JE14_EUCGL